MPLKPSAMPGGMKHVLDTLLTHPTLGTYPHPLWMRADIITRIKGRIITANISEEIERVAIQNRQGITGSYP